MLQRFQKQLDSFIGVFNFFVTGSEPLVDEYVLERLLLLFPIGLGLPQQPDMSLSKEINGDVNGAVVKSYSRGKTKLDNVFRKKGKLTRFQCSINAENKKNHPFKE